MASDCTIDIIIRPDVDPEGAWLCGATTCEHCGYRSMDVRPVGTQRLECGKCGRFYEDPAARDMIEQE